MDVAGQTHSAKGFGCGAVGIDSVGMVLVVNLNGRTVVAHCEIQPGHSGMDLARSGIVAVHSEIVEGRPDTEQEMEDLLDPEVVEIAEEVRKLGCWGIAAASAAQRARAAEDTAVDLVVVGKAGLAGHTAVGRYSDSQVEFRIA